MADELSKLYTPAQVAEMTSLHRNTIYRWIKEGQLPAVSLGPRRVYVTAETIKSIQEGQKYATRKNN